MPEPPVSFAADIRPVLVTYRDQMAWRLDLANYEDVKANAQIILGQIGSSPAGMPPTPFPPFPQDFIAKFRSWASQGCPA